MSSSQNLSPEDDAAAPPATEDSTTTITTNRPAVPFIPPTSETTNQESRVPTRHHHRRREHPDRTEFMMLTASAAGRRLDVDNALGITNLDTVPGNSTNTLRRGEESSTTPSATRQDSFADEYWFRVHHRALRAHTAPPWPPSTEERHREARRAYAGLTDMLHRLQTRSPEPK